MAECLFCKIAKKDVPAAVVYEDEWAMGFLDIHPLAQGHTVVIPKIHAENILELDDNAIGPLFKAVKQITAALKLAFQPQGFTIGINHGKVSGQAIDHLHIHLIPRWGNDGGKSLHAIVSNPPRESLPEIKEKILKVFQDGYIS
jgi:histidine triad (HIT) family protein